jgi:hypothetical protein
VEADSLNGFRLADADDVWPTLGPLPDRAEEALEECRAGRALFFTGEWGSFAVGLYPNDNGTGLEAFVLLAVAAKHGAFEVAEPHVTRIALDLKAETLAFRPARDGWARKLRRTAWQRRSNGEFWRPLHEREKQQPDSGDASAAGDD